MPKRELLHEWMHRFDLGALGMSNSRVLRVWTKAATESIREFNEQARELDRVIKDSQGQPELLNEIAALPFVNAAEFLNASGNGRLVYVDWP